MSQEKNLKKLMELRKLRTRLAEEASIRQQNAEKAAAMAVNLAADRIVQNDESRINRETAMYEQMSTGLLGRQALDDYQDALSALTYQAAHLQQMEEQAKVKLLEEAEKAREKAAEHLSKLRQHDKLELLLEKQGGKKDKRAGLMTELEDEDQQRPAASPVQKGL
ncbi:YscO family type III secretion system apparatus protein [Phyllobacterium sp. YR531]|uniref:type III secretion system stalk subunit SctO n=1 Tax=Phyllobacterium sp. YR531 TaxID=1144343 RepID=UPI00026F98B8|nr:YscO family type III secretion system apparatus protein [Phyllobacterium sp. YR531]EJN03655.1 hypothetical protein PMI41_02364 [Phyllobacterium sp. YR531]